MRLIILFLLLSINSIFSQESARTPEGKFIFPLNTQNAEYSPVIAPNGRYIVFQSNRPGGKGGMDIWLSENLNFKNRLKGKPIWSEPVNFSDLNTKNFEGSFTILFDKNGNPIEIFFTSLPDLSKNREGLEGLNVYYTKNLTRENPSTDKWSIPENLIKINSNFDDKMPAISPDGKTLVFSSNRPGGFGTFDLWVSNRDSLTGDWSNPVNLGKEINSSSNEIMPSFHYDGTSIYFSSDRDEEDYKYKFYVGDLHDDSLILADGEIRNSFPDESSKEQPPFPKIKLVTKLPSPFNGNGDNEGISFTHDGLWAYFASNRQGGEGGFDIYRARITTEMRRPYAFDLRGIVVDGSEQIMIGLDSTIKIFNEKGLVKIITTKRIGGDITTPSQDEPINFKTRLLTGTTYKITVSSPGFHPNYFTLDLKGSVGMKKSKYVKIILMPIKEETDPITPPPAKKTEPPEVIEPKDFRKSVVLKDYITKKEIPNGEVTLFLEKNRDGVKLNKENGKFKFEEPKEDFELTGKSEGYNPETLEVKADDTDLRVKKEFEIFLRKKGDFPAIYDDPIYFEFNEFLLKPSQKKILDKIIAYLNKNTKDIVEVGGHTDNIATKEYNINLSEKRAKEIKKYLVEKGIDKNRVKTKAYWYSIPSSDNSTEEGRAKNRRATFKKLN